MGGLQEKVAIVTGAGSGIGRAIAHRYSAEGASVFISDIDLAAVEKVADEISGPVRAMYQDIADEAGWAEVVDAAIDAFGKLDILVNNAASAIEGSPESATLADWRRILEVNVEGLYIGCRSVIPRMRDAGGGVIINIASTAAINAAPPQLAAYGASKAAVRQYTRTLARYCGINGDNIRCNSINPGAINTPMLQASISRTPDPELYARKLAEKAALGRIGEPEDIASAALFLASDEAGFITGAELNVDGGVSVA
jgi:NAD(P)-dependent dehydrogenase (short-subunit alcohol dehydrogenase family)